MSGPRSATGRSLRSAQHFAGVVVGFATLFGGCAYTAGGWSIIQWMALAVVLAAAAMVVFLQRLIRSAEEGYADRPTPAIKAREVRTRPADAPPPRLTAGAEHRTGRPADATRKAL